MLTAQVVTRSDEWVKNVITGIMNGVREVDFWTNGRLPDQKRAKDIKFVEVYYEGTLILQGDYVDSYTDTPNNVFNNYNKNLSSIGLVNGNSFSDFEKILNDAFTSPRSQKIGNIIFEVESVSKYALDLFSENNFNNNFNIVNNKTLQKNIQNIAYDEI